MKLMIIVLTVLFTQLAFAANVKRLSQDVLLPTQKVLERQSITTPILADDDRILNDQTTSASATTTVTSFLAQPDVTRGLTVTTGSTTADCNAGNVVVTGTNFFGRTISENIAITENQNGATAGTKAFKTVSSIVFPIQDGAGCTYSVGVGDNLGLKRCMSNAGQGAWTTFDGAYETTRAVWVADADEVEKNTVDPEGTLNGSKTVEAFFIQNWGGSGCLP